MPFLSHVIFWNNMRVTALSKFCSLILVSQRGMSGLFYFRSVALCSFKVLFDRPKVSEARLGLIGFRFCHIGLEMNGKYWLVYERHVGPCITILPFAIQSPCSVIIMLHFIPTEHIFHYYCLRNLALILCLILYSFTVT